MKRKWILIIGLVVCAGLGGFLGLKKISEKAEEYEVVQHKQEWELTGKTIKKIDITGLDQNLDVSIEESDNSSTKVILEGEVTSEIQKKMKQVKAAKDHLNLHLTEDKMVMVEKVGSASELTAKLTIILGENVTLKEFNNDVLGGNVSVKVPKSMKIKTDLRTQNNGKIKKVEDDSNAKTKIVVDSGGSDIDVKKY